MSTPVSLRLRAAAELELRRRRREQEATASNDPAQWAAVNLRILNKAGVLVPLHYNQTQRTYLANRTRRDLILKARQLGMSTLLQAENYRQCVTGTAITMTLAHDDDATQKLRRMADRFHENHPGLKPGRKYANASVTTYETGSEANISTAGNRHAGRAGTYQYVHGSEVAFWIDAEGIIAGAAQGGNPVIVLESTPNGAQGYFYQLCMETLDGRSDWRLHFYPWWWDEAYSIPLDDGEIIYLDSDEGVLFEKHGLTLEQIKWRRRKQRELKGLFSQEYPEDPKTCFLQSGFGYFGNTAGYFGAPMAAEPDPAHRYVAGLDFGQTQDYTVCVVIDATTRNMVEMVRVNRLSWQEMRARVVSACKRWGVSVLKPEVNSMGGTNIEALNEELRQAGCNTRLDPFVTDNASKASVMSALHEALASGALHLQAHSDLRHEMNAFSATQTATGLWRLAAAGDGHDDTVIALALAWDAFINARPTGGIFA